MGEELPSKLEEDPGDPLFVEYARELRDAGRLEDAVIVCLRGVSSNPDEYRGRLLLANLFYHLECLPFALRELNLLKGHFPESTSLKKLLEKLDPRAEVSPLASSTSESEKGAESAEKAKTVAETEFDFDDLDALSEDD